MEQNGWEVTYNQEDCEACSELDANCLFHKGMYYGYWIACERMTHALELDHDCELK